MKKSLAILTILAALVWATVFYFPDNNLHLIFCDVGQGDAILISRGLNQVLVDGGPNERVLQCLSDHLPFWDRKIEMVVLTHPQADHLTGLISVLERYVVKYFVINNLINNTERFWKFREVLLEEGAEIYNPKAGDKLKIAKINLRVLWPEEKLGNPLVWKKASQGDTSDKDTSKVSADSTLEVEDVLGAASFGNFNETSIVFRLEFGHFCALLTGDIGKNIESQLDKVQPCQVLKVGHHGSKSSTSDPFLSRVRPALAVISVGKNQFGHPSREVIERLRDDDIKILRTDQDGEIEIVSDGRSFAINKF